MSGIPVRHLGFVESLFAEFHDKMAGATQLVAVAELHGKLDPWAARRALETLYQRHPLLSVGLRRDSDGWWFVPAGSFDNVSVVIRPSAEADEWQRVFERELDDPLAKSGPLWRATILTGSHRTSSTLLMTVHHAITDGLSMSTLGRQFVEVHNRVVQGFEPEVAQLPLREPVERLLASAKRGEPSKEAPVLGATRLLEAAQVPEAAQWCFETPAPPAQRRARVLWHTFAPPDTKMLLERCLAERTTQNAAIVGALIVAAQSLPTRDVAVSCTLPTDIRQRTRPPISPEENGPFFHDVKLTFDAAEVADLDPWERARRIRAQYRERRALALAASTDFSATDSSVLAAAIAQSFDPNRSVFNQGFVVTNLGRQRAGASDAPLRLAFVQGTLSPRSGDFAVMLSVTTLGDRMSFGFTSADPLLSQASAEGFADAFVASLRQAL